MWGLEMKFMRIRITHGGCCRFEKEKNMDYLSYLNKNYPVRRSADQKAAFRNFALEEAKKAGLPAAEENDEEHVNLVIGSPESAEVLFTAHYDTPRRALIPNLMLVTNKVLHWLYVIGIPLIMVAIALGCAFLILKWTGYESGGRVGQLIWFVSYMVIYFGLFFLLLYGPTNRNNFNDNTSGTAAVLELARRLQGDKKVAFILFDDEEKGKKGSKAYAKAHPDVNETALVINMDCVGNGKHFVVAPNKEARKTDLGDALGGAFENKDGYEAHVFPAEKISMNSDQKSFKRSAGVCATAKTKFVGYWTGRIHTKYDTVVSEDNIRYLCGALEGFARNYTQNKE